MHKNEWEWLDKQAQKEFTSRNGIIRKAVNLYMKTVEVQKIPDMMFNHL